MCDNAEIEIEIEIESSEKANPTMSKKKKAKELLSQHPFDPPIIPERMVWTSSSMKLFRRCKRMFYWKYIMRLESRGKGVPLIIGSAAHGALEEWYKGKRSSMEKISARRLAEARKEIEIAHPWYNQGDIDKAEAGLSTFQGMMCGYDAIYRNERKEWKILRKNIERKFCMDMGDFDFQGMVDLIAQENKAKGKYFVVEHKTAASIPQSYIDRLPLDTQIKAYTYAAIEAFDIPVTSVVYDVIKKCKLRRKANETAAQFNDRITVDYSARPDFYFFREQLKFNRSDLKAFVSDMRLTHDEFMHILDTRDPTKPESWPMNDHAYTEYFSIDPFATLSTQGLNRGTAMGFIQRKTLHQELAEEKPNAS